MRQPFVRSWANEDLTADIIGEATPPAAVALLVEAVLWIESVTLTPYCGCAHSFDGCTTADLEERYLAAIVAPGASHGRATICRSWQVAVSGASTDYHQLWSTAGGTSGADVLRIPYYIMPGSGQVPDPYWHGVLQHLVDSGNSVIDSPASGNLDRQLELVAQDYPYVEAMFVTLASGFSMSTSLMVEDLELL